MAFNHKHLIDITEYSEEDIKLILETAKAFSEVNERAIKKVPTLKGNTIVNMFNEPSTRTALALSSQRGVFLATGSILAAPRPPLRVRASSIPSKRSTPIRSTSTIVRDKHAGAPPHHFREFARKRHCAGDGKHNHPTQALLDLYTIWEHKHDFNGLKVGIVGDIAHSRVCGSLIPALKTIRARSHYVVAPARLCRHAPGPGTRPRDDRPRFRPARLHVVYMLRIQHERLEGAPFPTIREYHKLFGLTKDREKLMKPDAIICHPGPINRGVEFDSYMADHPQRSVILEQVYAGICVRMAILYLLLGGADNGLASSLPTSSPVRRA